MPETETDTDLIDVIIQDHRRFQAVFAELEDTTGDTAFRKDLADHVIAEIVRHGVAEEQFVYPAARSRLPDGDEIVEHEIEEHAEAEQDMKELEGLGPEDPRFEELLAKMIKDVRHHLDEEEQHLLPRLREACDREELQDLGFKVLAAKEFAPTRPHPHAPDTPPGNLVLGPGIGFIDKIRDALSHRDV
ncbi:hemerythrin domain-containing protein [Glycomyces algeriensis]|uniref:Hemerythrin n=1 Tax=Glycomyces algeriensis TaxID=256037 RepID=A0A9W6G8M2_9ACTN|nr:hemerythrin domain-containing protein [Glycomyces algeriensis]MDA1365144.1 hemerythrin domain-containing protein [Glycomyces algeriensis]MDR7349792.1 hemerythrin superfamily protein [Glycomyces algeriensis]GLI42501.1 hemerythrin [Glycomyces algeriensis]